MIRTGFDSRVKIYDIIESQLPSFILEENPKAAEFLKQYYISQEYPGGPTDIAENLDQYLKFNIIQSDAVSNREVYLTSEIGTDNKITINVNSTKGFPEKYGLLKIDDEIITYTGITPTSFLNCQRGFSGITNYHEDLNDEELVFETTSVQSHDALSPVTNLSSLFVKEFFKKLKYTFAPGFEELDFNENLNIGNFIKSIRAFYQSKGTQESFEILFKILYGVDATVVNLENFLLKPSSAEYVRREVVLIENISGEPNNLVGQSIQKENDETTNASVSEVEVVTRNFKRYYKLSLFVGYDDFSTVQGNFIVTPKSKCTETVSIGSSIISVDSTIGFENSGTLISGDNTITYTSKSVNQFFGCTGVNVEIPLSEEIRSGDVYFGYENGDRTKKVTFTILGSLSNFKQISEVLHGVSEGDDINIKSVGDPIGRTKNYKTSFKEIFVNSWVYNTNSRWKIKNFNGPKSLNLSSSILKDDKTSFKYGDSVEIVERGTNNVVFTSHISEEIGENSTSIKILGSFVPVNGVNYDLRRKLNKASSLNTPLKFGNDSIISDITNVYTNTTDAYVASNSLPSSNRGLSIPYNYQITKELDQFYIDDTTGTLIGQEDINYSIIAFENAVTFLTGDRIYYEPEADPLVGLEPGYYFVEIVSADNKKIKLYSSTSFIGTNNYQLFRSPYISGLGKHNFILASQKSAVIGPQKLLRKFPLNINPNLTDSASKDILPGQIGLLVNGVEIDSYKSADKIYYGPLKSVNILNSGTDYDVINLPIVSVVDGTGDPAKIQPVVSGSIEKIYVEPQNFDIEKIVSIGVNGGNGRGAVLEPILNLRVREVLFDGRATTNGGGINTTTGQLTFNTDHNFPDGEEIFYNVNGNQGIGVGIGTSTLTDGASYYPKSTSPRTVYLYPSFKDYTVGLNTIRFNTDNNFGVHKFYTKSNKKTLTEIKILDGGEGYTNRKLIVKPSGITTSSSTINFPNHGFNSGDLIVYNYETSPIIGIPTSQNNQFYVLKVNNDSFRLCDAGVNGTISSNYERKNYIKFKDQGSGYQYFQYPDISVYVEFTSIGISSEIQPTKLLTVTPSVKGKIIDAYLYETGTGYGSTTLNFEKKPKIVIKNGKEAKVTPNINQGRINTVRIEYGGLEYYSTPDIIAVDPTGKGSGAEFLPIIENARIKEIRVLNAGIGYSATTTIKVVPSGSNALFDSRVRDLTVNNVKRFGSENYTDTLNNDLKYSVLSYSEKLQNSFSDDGQNHSKIIGWAYDGNPIYGAYGYSDPENVNSNPKPLVSGYVLNTSYQNRPSLSNYPAGFFVNDYEYVGTGDLDKNNGRFGKTPEFPLGTYAYFSPINSVSKLSQFPYFIGNSFKSNVISENFYLNQDTFDFAGQKVSRNTYPYKLIDPNVESDFLSSFYDLKNQVVKVRSTSSGTIDGYNLISKGENYKTNDIIYFKSNDDEALTARVSSIDGKDVKNIVCEQQYYSDVIVTKENSQKLKLSILPSHDITSSEFVSLVGFSTQIAGLDGIYKVGISTVVTTLSKDIAPAVSIGATEIYVSTIPEDIVPGSFIGIGTETATVLNTYKVKNIIAIGRTVTGVGHSAKTQIELIPNSFTIDKSVKLDIDSKLNNKIYFNPKYSIGVGTLSGNSISTSFAFADFTVSRDIPTRSIYLESHPFITNQKISFTPPAGTISVSTDGTNTFSIPLSGQSQELYVVNKSINSIGLKTSFDAPELFFHTNGVDDDNYLLETTFDQIKGSITRFRTTVSTSGTHGLSEGDSVVLSVKPGLNVGIGTSSEIVVSYNESYKKLLFDSVGFGSTSISTSQFYYNKPTQQSTINTYVGLGFTVGLGSTGSRSAQQIYDYIWQNYDAFDLDGDGVVSYTDGLIASREMTGVGFTGDNLIQGVIFPGNATRRTSSEIRTHIDSVTNSVGIGSTLFDINNSGVVNSDIDGELLIRFSTTVGLGNPGTYNPSKIRGSINIENHQFETGDKVLYLSNDDSPLVPLDDGEYYVISADENSIQLALTYKDCIGDSPNAVSIGFTGSENQSIALINPKIEVIKSNTLNFNLQDESLSDYDFEIFYDENFKHKFISTKESGTFSVSKVGTPGISSTASISITCDDSTPRTLYYSLTKDGLPLTPDFDTLEHSTIVYEDSLYIKNDSYTISGVGSTTFNLFLERIPEKLSYTSNECKELKYTTNSKSAFGPINQIEITSGKALYGDVPVLTNIQTDNGRDANITLQSDTIGDIKEVQITNEGFSYHSDPTLQPTAYISPQIFIKDSNGIKDIEVTNGGSNYNSEPAVIIVDVVSGQKLDTGILSSVLSGTSISSIIIEQQPKGLPDTEIKLVTLNNSNGFSIQRVSTYTSTIFDIYISQPTDGFVTPPFEPGDEIFIENIQSSVDSIGSGFNSSDYGYNFFKVIDFNTSGLLARIRVDATEFTAEVGEPKTIQDFVPIVTNKKVYPEFKIVKERLTFAIGEKLYAGGSEIDLKIASSNTSYIKVFGSYELTENEIITGRQSGTVCTISEIKENNAKFEIDYSTKVITGWSNNIGKLNNDIQIIPDNDYYQNLSYTIKSPINYEDSKTVVNNFLHTIGTKNFSDTGITSESKFVMTSEDSTTVIKDFISDHRVDTINGFDMVRDIDSFGGYSNFLKFDSKLLTPYIKNTSNRVLKIDNINKQFSNLESNLNPYLDVINVSTSNNQYIEVLAQVTNVDKTEIQLTNLVIVKNDNDSFLLEKGSIVSVGSSILEYDNEKLGEFTLETRNTEHYLRFNPQDYENTDYDLKLLQGAFKSNAIGIASTSIGFIKQINSIQRSSGLSTTVGLTTNIVSLDSTLFNSIHVSAHITDDLTNDMQYSELYITHDGENTYMTEFYFDDFGYDGNAYSSELIGSFSSNLDSNVLSLDFENTTSQNNITVKASIVGFGSISSGIGTYRFKKASIPAGLERSAFYESKFGSSSGNPIEILNQESVFVNSAKSMVEVSIGSTKAVHQVLSIYDGSNVYVKQLPFLSVSGISTADTGVGLGTFGGSISGGRLIVSFYPDQEFSGTFRVSTLNKVFYTEVDSINIAPDLDYYDNGVLFGKDSVSVKYYNSFNGERINKTDFLMFSDELAVFSREIDTSDPTHIDLTTGTIYSEKHFFSENEEIIYTPKSTINGIGSTALLYKSDTGVIGQLPGTVYIVNKEDDSFQISTTKAGIAVTFIHKGEGNAHVFEMKKKNEKCVFTIDDVIQYPVFPKQVYYQLSDSITAEQTTFQMTGISTVVPKNILQIGEEYMNVLSVGYAVTSTGPIVGFGTYPLVTVKRGFLGTASTSHNASDDVSVNVGAFNIVGNTLHFTDPPKGNVQEDKDAGNLDSIKSDFTGRVFLRKDYTTNVIYDDISKEFNGVGRTFSLTVGGANTVGLGTSGGNGLLLINGLFQTPSTSNNPQNNFSLVENSGITSVVFSAIRQDNDIVSDYDINQNDRPRGGLIVSLGSNLGIGYAPLVGARVKPIVSAAGTITSVVGSSYTGTPVAVSTASYNNFSGVIEITTEEPHMLSENDLVRLSGLGFTCPSTTLFRIPNNQIITTENKVTAYDAELSDRFGWSVAAGDDRVVIGNYRDDDAGSGSGSAYIFDLGGNLLSKITASDAAAGDYFGEAVAVGSNRIVVGAHYEEDNGTNSGSAYIFDLDGNELAKISASDGDIDDRFSSSAVAVGSNRIVIGAYQDDDNGSSSGSAYIFDLNGTQLAKITAFDGAADDDFGASVAVGSNRIVVGAPYDDDNALSGSGSAYIFDLDGNLITKITASNPLANAQFGRSVAIGNDLIAIGCPSENSGAVYIFDLNGNELTKVVASDGGIGLTDRFGYSVAIGNDIIFVGAYQDDDNGTNTGSVYVYDLEGNDEGKITASDAVAGDFYGYSVAVGSDVIVVGAYRSNSETGSAYIYNLKSSIQFPTFFPRSTNTDLENHFPIISVASSTTFLAQAGTSTLPHTYVGYGTIYPWYDLNIGSGYRGPVSIGITQEGHVGTAASITVNVGAGGTLSFTVNDGGSGYSTTTKAVISLPDPSYQQLEIEGVSRVGIGSTTETGVGLLLNLEVDSNPYYAGGRFLDAANLIDRNLQFIADVSVGRMLAYYPGFSVPGGNVNCVDDVKSVLETVVYNMRFGGNDRVYEAAEVYLNNQALLAGEEEQSIYTFNVARDLAIDVMRNKPIVTRSITSGTFADAANLISANKELIADVAVGRMLSQYPGFVIPGQQQIQPTNVTYEPVSGLSTITYANHGLFVDDIIRIAPGSLTFTCSSDDYQTEVSYPRENDDNIYGQDIRIISVTDNTFTINAGVSTAVNHQPTDATYDPATGISTITIPNHGLIAGTRVFMTAGGFTFTCGMDNNASQHTYPRQSDDNYNTTVAIASTTTNTITLQLAASGPNQYYTPTDVTYDPATGISTITIGEHNLAAGLPIIIQDNSLTFTCDMDGNQTQKSYPRPAANGKAADYASGRSISIASTTDTTITLNVGASGENQLFTPTDATYDSTTGDLVLTIGAHTLDIGEGIVIVQDSIVFSCDQDNYSTLHAYPRDTDPYGNNRSVNIIGITSTTITVNVGDAGSAVGAAHSFVSAAANSIQHLPQSVHTFVGAATSAIQHLPQVGHTFVSALSNAIVSGGEYNHQFVGASSTAITININRECTDDIEDVLGTIAFNLTYGGNDAVYDAAKIYVDNAYLAGEEEQSIYAYEQARDLAIQAMRNEVITIDGYSTKTQVIDNSILVDPSNPTCAPVASAIDSFVGIVTQAIGLGTLPNRTVNTTLYTTESQIIDNTVIGDASQTPGVYDFDNDCANVASAIGSYVGIVTQTIANVVAYGATATHAATKTVAPGSMFSIKNFNIARAGYSFKPGDVIRPVGLVTDYRLQNPVSEFELTVLDTFTDSFALWQFGNLDYIDSIAAYQDGSRLAFPLYYNGQLLSFEKDKDSDFDIRNLLVIFINGILQEPGKSFDFNGGTTFVFTTAPKKEDNISIFFYRGTIGSDSSLVSDIPQTIKIGDTVQVLKNDSYPNSQDQNVRLVQNVEFADRIETNLYSGPGIDAVNPKPISWAKQKRDKFIFGQTIYKTRESLEGQVYPTTKLISGLTTTSTEIFVESAKMFNYNNEVAAKPFNLLVVNGISTTPVNSVELLDSVQSVKGFAGVITGITSTTGIGTDKAIQFYVNNLDSNSFINAGIETGYHIYIYDTTVGSGVTTINSTNEIVGIGNSYLDSIYHISGWSGVIGDDNVGIITCNVHPDSDLSGISTSGTEVSPIGKFTWGRLSGFTRSSNPISIDISSNVPDVGLTTYPTIQRRGIGLKLVYETGALPSRLV